MTACVVQYNLYGEAVAMVLTDVLVLVWRYDICNQYNDFGWHISELPPYDVSHVPSWCSGSSGQTIPWFLYIV